MHSISFDGDFFQVLRELDREVFVQVKSKGCPHCGAPLDTANFRRKTRGMGEGDEVRFGLCCRRDGCRKRQLPKSLRFLGRKVYGAWVVILALDYCRELGLKGQIARQTIARWKAFWRAHLSAGAPSELRLLSMEKFDSASLLTVVLAGDSRLTNAFKEEYLIPLGTRMKTRLIMEPWMKPQLIELLKEGIKHAGNPSLMTDGLIETLSEHAAGSPRVLINLAGECLAIGMMKEATHLDESLFFELFPPQSSAGNRRKASQTAK